MPDKKFEKRESNFTELNKTVKVVARKIRKRRWTKKGKLIIEYKAKLNKQSV